MKDSKQEYVQKVLQHYLSLPETPKRFSRLDHRLAESLYDQGVREEEMAAAMLLATASRLRRNPQAPALGPIRSLYYFLPVLQEVRKQSMSPGYLQYVRETIRQALAEKAQTSIVESPPELPAEKGEAPHSNHQSKHATPCYESHAAAADDYGRTFEQGDAFDPSTHSQMTSDKRLHTIGPAQDQRCVSKQRRKNND